MSVTPDDVADLRRGIDHIGVSVVFIIHDGHGNVLLQKRGRYARDEQGRWDCGGGAIEFGEPIDDAVEREIYEELNVKPLKTSLLTVYEAHRRLPDGARTHWVAIVHAVEVDPQQVSVGEPHKIERIAWFTSQNLPSPLHSQFWKGYKIALEKGIVK